MKQKFIEWFTKNNNGCSPAMEDDRSFVYEMTQHMFEAYQAGVAEGEARCAALAAENAMLKQRTQQLIDIISNTDNDYCMCGSAMKDHVHSGCGYPTGMFDYYYNQWLGSDNKTPATDAFLAEVKTEARKEGAYFVANRMLAAWEAGFIDDTAKNAADIARMILTSTEFMANAPEGDFDRSFSDGVLEDIAAQLRKGVQS